MTLTQPHLQLRKKDQLVQVNNFTRHVCVFCYVTIKFGGKNIFHPLLMIRQFIWHLSYTLNVTLRYFSQFIYILLTKREGRTGRISTRGLDSTDRAQRGPYKKDRGPIFSQYGPEQVWLIRDLLHD